MKTKRYIAAAAHVTSAQGASPRSTAASCGASVPRGPRSRPRKNTTVIQVNAGMKSLLARFRPSAIREGRGCPADARVAASGRYWKSSRYEMAPNVTYQMSMTAMRESTMNEPVERHRRRRDEGREPVPEELPAAEIRDADEQRSADGVEDAVAVARRRRARRSRRSRASRTADADP
jgi:hypothetical protein